MRGLLVLLLFSSAALPAQAAPKKPNIVVIDVCSARADHLGAYGYSRPTSPRIDALAKQGAVFENAMAQSSWCLPNYASLFTGQTPEVHGLYVNQVRGIPEFEATLAEKLKDDGYATAAFSGGVYMLPEWGMARGFDTYVTAFSTAEAGRLPAPLEDNLQAVSGWLDGRDKRQPFMLYVAVDNLHAPYNSPDPSRFDPGYHGVAEDTDTASVPFARAYSGEPAGFDAATAKKAAAFKKDARALPHLVARYDAAVAEGDAEIGRFLDRLKKLGLDKNTIVVLTGDHGESLGEHGLLGHTQGLYEPTLRVPLIVRDPRRPHLAGRRYKQLIERVDLMPTILDFAGADYSELSLAGRSFAPLLADPAAPWRRIAFAASKRNLSELSDLNIDERVARDERWKLLHSLYKDDYELYDLQNDPLETKNVAAENPDVVRRLSFELLKQVERGRPKEPGLPDKPRQAPPSLSETRSKL